MEIRYHGCDKSSIWDTVHTDNNMILDIAQKHVILIAKVNSLLQEFYFVSPDILFKLMKTYAIYGIWDIVPKRWEEVPTGSQIFPNVQMGHRGVGGRGSRWPCPKCSI